MLYQSRIDSFLTCSSSITYGGESYTVTRVQSGPATTLVIKKSKTGEEVTAVDVVACVGGRVVHPR